jgi:hypothetical protein
MGVVSAALKCVLTAVVFLLAYKVGLDVAAAEKQKQRVMCPGSGPSSGPGSGPSSGSGAVTPTTEFEFEPPVEEHSLVADEYMYTPFVFHKYRGKNVNDRVFTSLYHSNSQAKAEFVITPLEEWEDPKTKKIKCTDLYRTNTGSRDNQPAKCVAIVTVPDGYNAPVPQLHRVGYTAKRLDQFINDYTRHENRREGETMLPSFMRNIEELKQSFLEIVGSPNNDNSTSASSRKTLVVMVANSGVFNLLLNFMCSCRTSGIDTKSVVVFVGEAHHVGIVKSMGATPVYLPAMGEMPTKVAGNYGDKVFGKMMWLKVSF